MKEDPLNLLPADPDALRKLDEHAERVAEELGGFAIVVVAQEGKKIMLTTAAKEESDFYKKCEDDLPLLLMLLASQTMRVKFEGPGEGDTVN